MKMVRLFGNKFIDLSNFCHTEDEEEDGDDEEENDDDGDDEEEDEASKANGQ